MKVVLRFTIAGAAALSIVAVASLWMAVTSKTDGEWQWDFGDGSSGLGPRASLIYETPGIYRPTVTVVAAEGTFEAVMSRDTWVQDDSITIAEVEVGEPALSRAQPLSSCNDITIEMEYRIALQSQKPAVSSRAREEEAW